MNSSISIPAVEFRDVSKSYGAVVAVDSVSLTIDRGAMLTLLGPSGCGKTTTLRLIAGLEAATTGKIFVDGVDVTERPPSARNISMVFQSYALFPHMSVTRNVTYGLVASGRPAKEARATAAEALALVGLAHLGNRLPSELSGGQQQRVAVARAIVLEPAVLLLDEPLSNLDARLRRQVRDDIREIQQRLALTAVYVTHDQDEALAVSDTIVVMNGGRVAQAGAPRSIYSEPTDRFVAGFVGDANIVRADFERIDAARGLARLGEATLPLTHRDVPAGSVELVIRPEAIVIRAADVPGPPGIAGTIRRASFLGDRLEYTVDTGVGQFFATVHPDADEFAPGTAVALTFRSVGITVLPA